MKILVTGGAGFIGSAFIRHLLEHTQYQILNVDKFTYAANIQLNHSFKKNNRYQFCKIDICNFNDLSSAFNFFEPDLVVNFAAESHVDRSIAGPQAFIETNIIGTFNLLEVSRCYWGNLPRHKQSKFRFLHISTDEVYGDASEVDQPFTEQSVYRPSSPYPAIIDTSKIRYGLSKCFNDLC
ncbi:GDP-mannose 4,6-dehydratase [Acinetobacter shaoyimingii]|uniref:GDP-mannose 4,6-dehydratase n=1 Tax=Acinetobacter shaoyimingii TaxID=2715164 RepID=UPI001D0F0FD8|nr:GDP-mannose 4,6-dehydratase [Acinetobacter shaoyimingii]